MTLRSRPPPGPGANQRRRTGTGTGSAQGEQTLLRLMARVAHDVNNLLGAISNHLYLIEKGGPSADRELSIAAIRRSVEKGSQLTHQLQCFARPRSDACERLLLAHRLPALSTQLCALLGHGLQCRVCVEPGTPAVWVTSGALELALLRLALDAIDAASAHRSPPEAPKLTLYARPAAAGEAPALAANNPSSTHERYVKLTLTALGEAQYVSWYLPAATDQGAAERKDQALDEAPDPLRTPD